MPRPAICGAYRCALLKRYERGKISFAEAGETVNRVLRLRKAYKKELARVAPESYKVSVWESRTLLPENEAMIADPVLLKKWGVIMMCYSALLDCLQTNFHFPDKRDKKG